MPNSVARVATDQPERYLKQLVSHLGHRLTAAVADDGAGVVETERGRCALSPQAGVLVLTATAEDDDAMAHLQDVVGRHLERFGAREGLRVTWSPASP